MKKYINIGLLAFAAIIVHAQTNRISFEHITIDDGLSSNEIRHIFSDSHGFLWICSNDGLSRYDGYQFKHFKHKPDDLNSLSEYSVYHGIEDSNGLLWLATRNGLDLFDPRKEIFTHFLFNDKDTTSISSDKILYTAADNDGNIWVGTRFGLNHFNVATKKFKRFLNNVNDNTTISSNYITSVYPDRNGNLWIGTEFGLNRFNREKQIFEHFLPDSLNPKNKGKNRIACIFEDNQGKLFVGTFAGLYEVIRKNDPDLIFVNYLANFTQKDSIIFAPIKCMLQDKNDNYWIGTYNFGLITLNTKNKILKCFQNSTNDSQSISQNKIQTILIDKNENIWIGTLTNGINKISWTSERFSFFKPIESVTKNESGNSILSLLIDCKRRLWVGTEGAGIFVYKLDSIFNSDNILIRLQNNPLNKNSLSNDFVTTMIEDDQHNIWIGTFGGGLNRFNANSYKFDIFKNNPDNPETIGDNFIHVIFEDSKKRIWIGTALSGLQRFLPESNTFEHFKANPKYFDNPDYISAPEVTAIVEANAGLLWIGTTDGLNRFDYAKKYFTHFRHSQKDKNSISSTDILSLYYDTNYSLWVGTYKGGLNHYNSLKNSFIKYSENDGIPNSNVHSISEDENNNILIATDKGISLLNVAERNVKNFGTRDGITKMGFNPGAMVKDARTGMIFFGGTNGLIIYKHSSISVNNTPPKIVITDFKLFNETITDTTINSVSIPYADEITLSYDQNVITFEFAALDFTDPEKLEYAYMLEGFDKDLVYSKKKREATYTNLSPGSYVFRVKGTNSDGIWNEEGTYIKMVVNPPFWKTWWAYLLYFILAATGLFLVRKYELNRIKLRNDLKNKEFESKKLQEVDQLKSRFFANISHEFRTPLAIILGSLEKLKVKMENTSDDKEFNVMERNALRLLQLINQLLELSRIESGNVKLQTSENDIVKFLRRIISSFSSLTYKKKIDVTFNGVLIDESNPIEEIPVYFDKKKFETVFYNILSNAVKFTPEGGNIGTKIFKENETVKIVFENTGVEIPSREIDRIFDRFYQVDDSGTRNFEGTGIGLSLVKEYIELHKGKIEVQSGNNKTTFTVYLPLGKSHLKYNEIVEKPADDILMDEYIMDKESLVSSEIFPDVVVDSDKTIVLIVEDNPDLREMIKENLQDTYSVIEAKDGVKAFTIAEEKIPDLIISDIMMPEMDGYELTKKIKTNEKTNHIPIILLTAKAATEDKLEGLETGADDYLIKPFNEKELLIRVRNLIKIRQQMREKYLAQSLIKPGSVVVPSSQKVFIDKLTLLIEKNLTNDTFSVEVLCKEIGMSRTQLHRKIKSVTNQSTTEFIRNYRLQLAAELLDKDAGNIAEVSNKVGFGSQAYFTKLFQELYGVTPLEYKKQHKK